MVKGIDIFRERFRSFPDSLVLIGGAACDEWFSRLGMTFRATRDLDIVLILEAVTDNFVAAMRGSIDEGGYEIRERSEGGPPVLYRFSKPTDDRFPAMLEIFSRLPEGISLADDQTIVPIPTRQDSHSLSAILVDADYHALIRLHQEPRDGIAFVTATALIPLKAKAWLDLSERKLAGQAIDAKDITKHRADVFRLAATLPGDTTVELTAAIRADLATFLKAFPDDSPEWPAILSAIKNTVGGNLRPDALRTAIQTFFQVS
ncbi:MAG: hypothetical protein NTW21_11050 [Verrucomicrobia bacterium]|nr:hypothetical protein [Verrucomicrobiota bacterium]